MPQVLASRHTGNGDHVRTLDEQKGPHHEPDRRHRRGPRDARRACLLGAAADSGLGKLAWANPDGRILVVPVNYGRDRHTTIVRTGNTELLDRARTGTRAPPSRPHVLLLRATQVTGRRLTPTGGAVQVLDLDT
jgi:hypothetical protein